MLNEEAKQHYVRLAFSFSVVCVGHVTACGKCISLTKTPPKLQSSQSHTFCVSFMYWIIAPWNCVLSMKLTHLNCKGGT